MLRRIKMQEDSGEEQGEKPSGGLKQGDECQDRKHARSDDDSNDEDEADADAATADDDSHDNLAKLRREKRLAMNRESARLRRSRKKVLLKTLEERVDELTRENQNYKVTNDILNARVQTLERDLAGARSTITSLLDRKSQSTAVHSHVADARRLLEAQQALAHQYVRGVAASSLHALPPAGGASAVSAARAGGLDLSAVPGLASRIPGRLVPPTGDFASVRGGLHEQYVHNTVSLLLCTPSSNRIGDLRFLPFSSLPFCDLKQLPGVSDLGLPEGRIDEGVNTALLLDAISPRSGRSARDMSASQILEEMIKQRQQQQQQHQQHQNSNNFGPKF